MLLGIESPKDGPVTAETVAQAYADGDFDGILEYCSRDVAAVMRIMDVLRRLGAAGNGNGKWERKR